MTYLIRKIQPFVGSQIILWLEDEQSKQDGPGDGTQWCVRVTIDEAPELIKEFIGAYAACMGNVIMELAAGGCRTCRGDRVVRGEPCPNCMPRAIERIRKVTHLKPKVKP